MELSGFPILTRPFNGESNIEKLQSSAGERRQFKPCVIQK